jgi:hypothetical protein
VRWLILPHFSIIIAFCIYRRGRIHNVSGYSGHALHNVVTAYNSLYDHIHYHYLTIGAYTMMVLMALAFIVILIPV